MLMKGRYFFLIMVIVFSGLSSQAQAALTVFSDKAAFLATTDATSATGPLPFLGYVSSAKVGSITISNTSGSSDPSLAFGESRFDLTSLLPGVDLTISGVEDLNILFDTSTFAFGFDFAEHMTIPSEEGSLCGGGSGCVDSTFTVTLLLGSTLVDSFSFNAPNDVTSFVGVSSTEVFDRVEIRETQGGIENDYFGQFYTQADCPLSSATPDVTSRIFNNGRAMELKFRPNSGLTTLDEMASACGYDHFNWLNIVTAHPRPALASLLPIFDPLPVDVLLWWHDHYPFYWDEPPAPFNAINGFVVGDQRNTPDAYTFRFEDNPYDAIYAGPGSYIQFRTFLVGIRSVTDFDLLCFAPGCGLEWKSNNNGSPGTGVEYSTGNIYETFGGTGGIFDVKTITLEEVSLVERSLLISAGVTNVDFAQISLRVTLDIKPDSSVNSINPRSRGNIPVAILSAGGFDATSVDVSTVKFGSNDAVETHSRGHIEDVDGDGDNDLVLHFATQDTGIQCGDTSATFTGETFSGQALKGSDSIETVGCK